MKIYEIIDIPQYYNFIPVRNKIDPIAKIKNKEKKLKNGFNLKRKKKSKIKNKQSPTRGNILDIEI